MFGTIFRMRPKAGRQGDVLALFDEWERERAPKVRGAIAGYVMRPLDRPDELVGVAVFAARASYEANAQDPAQDAWYRRLRELLEADPVWEDGEYLVGSAAVPTNAPSAAAAPAGAATPLLSRNLGTPDETRPFAAHGHVDVVTLGSMQVGRGTFEPGWRWSQDVKPIAKTDSCQASHNGYVLSGRLHVRMDDGREAEVGPGDAMVCGPGHDAWVVGDEPCVILDFAGMATYAQPAASAQRAATA